MGFFDFFKNSKKEGGQEKDISTTVEDLSRFGNDFEFLIVGDIDVFDDWDNIMMPKKNFFCEIVERDNWRSYIVDKDEYYYSIEPPGIQMVFSKGTSYDKAKAIANEVVENIKSTGQSAELIEINSNVIYKFE